MHVQRLIQQTKPRWHQRLMSLFMGRAGEKVMPIRVRVRVRARAS